MPLADFGAYYGHVPQGPQSPQQRGPAMDYASHAAGLLGDQLASMGLAEPLSSHARRPHPAVAVDAAAVTAGGDVAPMGTSAYHLHAGPPQRVGDDVYSAYNAAGLSSSPRGGFAAAVDSTSPPARRSASVPPTLLASQYSMFGEAVERSASAFFGDGASPAAAIDASSGVGGKAASATAHAALSPEQAKTTGAGAATELPRSGENTPPKAAREAAVAAPAMVTSPPALLEDEPSPAAADVPDASLVTDDVAATETAPKSPAAGSRAADDASPSTPPAEEATVAPAAGAVAQEGRAPASPPAAAAADPSSASEEGAEESEEGPGSPMRRLPIFTSLSR